MSTLLAVAELRMDQAAKDDAERSANRARLYKPPPDVQSEPSRRAPGRMDQSQAMRMMAELADEDAELMGRRRGRSE